MDARIAKGLLIAAMGVTLSGCSADMDEPHNRFTVCAGMECGSSALSTTMRAIFMPCSPRWITQPQIRSSISAGSSASLRASMPLMTVADRSSARTLRKQPFLERPMALRA